MNTNPNLTQEAPQGSRVAIKPITKVFLLVCFVLISILVGVGAYLMGLNKGLNTIPTQNNDISNKNIQTPGSEIPLTTGSKPKLAAFMRKGDIWIVDLSTNKTNKISKTTNVSDPKLSHNGSYVYYFAIDHSTGGFPRYAMYVSDTAGKNEKALGMGANSYASKIQWSPASNLLGVVLFGNDIPGGPNYSEKAFIYNAVTQDLISLGNVTRSSVSNDQYILDGSCNQLQPVYTSFCNEYTQYLNVARGNNYRGDYKRDSYQKSRYTKSGYTLSRSEKINNGIVVLEYYTGTPNNPESKWGEGGGSFIPGYDDGVTETYTTVLDEKSGEVIYDLPLAISTDFVF